jgi:O-antigen/teichoic acid export membrane protein
MTNAPTGGVLRDLVLRGSAYLAARQVLSMMLGIVGAILLTRELGPSEYGRYVGSLAIVTFLTVVTRFGIDTYVIRRPESLDTRSLRVTFTVMLLNGCTVLLGGVLLAPVTVGPIVGEAFVAPFQALLVGLVCALLLAPGLASLERDLRYRRVAFIELGNTIVFYCVAVPVAFAEGTVWAPVSGFLAAQLFSLVATLVVSRFPVGLAWSRGEVREIVRFGTPLTLAAACSQGRQLVNPIVVGGLLGTAAVGQVGLALRIADMLRFVSATGYRVSVSALARVAGERDRLSRAVSEGMLLQILGCAPFLGLFAVASGWIIPAALGDGWEETVTVFPLIATATLVFSMMSLQASLLYVVGQGKDVLLANAVSLALLALGAAVAIRFVDSPVAYGVGELLSIAGLYVSHRAAARFVATDYRSLVPWLVASLALFPFPWLGLPWGLPLFLPAAALLARRSSRALLRGYAESVMPRRRRPPGSEAVSVAEPLRGVGPEAGDVGGPAPDPPRDRAKHASGL